MTDPSPIRVIPNDYSYYRRLDSEKKEVRPLRILPASSPNAPLCRCLDNYNISEVSALQRYHTAGGDLEKMKQTNALFQDSVYVSSTCTEDGNRELNDTLNHKCYGRTKILKGFNITTPYKYLRGTFLPQKDECDRFYMGRYALYQPRRCHRVIGPGRLYESNICECGVRHCLVFALFVDESVELGLFVRAVKDRAYKVVRDGLKEFIFHDWVKA